MEQGGGENKGRGGVGVGDKQKEGIEENEEGRKLVVGTEKWKEGCV